NVQDGPVDERWEWAIPLLLDPAMRAFLEVWRDADPEQMDKPNYELLPHYIDEYLALDPARLGPPRRARGTRHGRRARRAGSAAERVNLFPTPTVMLPT